MRSLEGLFYVAAFGTLILSNNDLDWNELQRIRHVHILDLTLRDGNQELEMDAYCKYSVRGFTSKLANRGVYSLHYTFFRHYIPHELYRILAWKHSDLKLSVLIISMFAITLLQGYVMFPTYYLPSPFFDVVPSRDPTCISRGGSRINTDQFP